MLEQKTQSLERRREERERPLSSSGVLPILLRAIMTRWAVVFEEREFGSVVDSSYTTTFPSLRSERERERERDH